MSGGMHDYTLTIEWRDGATKTTTIRSDDPQRFIRALSADRDVVVPGRCQDGREGLPEPLPLEAGHGAGERVAHRAE